MKTVINLTSGTTALVDVTNINNLFCMLNNEDNSWIRFTNYCNKQPILIPRNVIESICVCNDEDGQN